MSGRNRNRNGQNSGGNDGRQTIIVVNSAPGDRIDEQQIARAVREATKNQRSGGVPRRIQVQAARNGPPESSKRRPTGRRVNSTGGREGNNRVYGDVCEEEGAQATNMRAAKEGGRRTRAKRSQKSNPKKEKAPAATKEDLDNQLNSYMGEE